MLNQQYLRRKFPFFARYLYLSLLPTSTIILFFVGIEPTLAINPAQTIVQTANLDLVARGKNAYQAGRYTEAQQIWQQVYQGSSDRLMQAQIAHYLALTSHKLGEFEQAQQYLDRGLKLLSSEGQQKNNLQIHAQLLNTQGRLQLSMGDAEAALISWQETAKIYREVKDDIGVLGAQINQAQAWQSLGLYRRAQKSLLQIAQKLEAQNNPNLQIAGWRNLALALQVTGDLERAEETLKASLALSQELNLPEESSLTLLNLGNVALVKGDRKLAKEYYQQVVNLTSQPLLQIETKLKLLNIAVAENRETKAHNLVKAIASNLSQIDKSPSRKLVYSEVNLAENLLELNEKFPNEQYIVQTKQLLETATNQARKLQDLQAESYSLGMLGYLYKVKEQFDLSRQYTERAIQLAHSIHNDDLIYQWQWQLGRILSAQGNSQKAIASYTVAVEALESLRSDLLVTNRELKFSFRESIEPVYRELVSLLLMPKDDLPVSQANLLKARNTIESLQLAELNNFFREVCIDATPTAIDEIDQTAAVIYPIILSDSLEIIVSLPDKSLRHYSQPISRTKLESTISELRHTLPIRSRRTFLQPAQQLYSWLMSPIMADLQANQIETLVFVPDGALRNIPTGVLYDGEQYLIQQYNLALTPGLQLLNPLPIEEVELKTLVAGITQKRRGFSALDYVNQELIDIKSKTNGLVLQDDKFTHNNLKEKVKTEKYPIVHIATHGQFSSNLEDTFLLAWDDNIDIQDLENLLKSNNYNQQSAIELLILSACETAAGDDRAALGLAGMAVRAGARTTLATLWSVSDRSTTTAMNYFYQGITQPQTRLSKAEALRQAQLELLNSPEFSHPYYWAPFVIVGNWL
ncbi:MAG: CHAT domain-containing protein [Cyanobacteria bacterium P01_F01_bin.143]